MYRLLGYLAQRQGGRERGYRHECPVDLGEPTERTCGDMRETGCPDLQVLAEGIETNKRNFTRFLAIADRWTADEMLRGTDKNKSSLVFALPHTSGSLSKVLSVLSFYDMNLSKIQSLPIIGREWEYLFYINLTFTDYLRYKQALDAIRPLTKDLKILGEYAEGKQSV